MAYKLGSRLQETSTTTGTANLTLAGAATGKRAFSAELVNTDTTGYLIEDANGTAWEVGIGTWVTGPTLQRTTILKSSTGSIISLSAGTHTVSCVDPTDHLTNVRQSGFMAYGDGTNTQTLGAAASTTLITGNTSTGATRTVGWNVGSFYTASSGIFFPTIAGLWQIGATTIAGVIDNTKIISSFISHSTDGTAWTHSGAKSCVVTRSYAAETNASVGGSGSMIVNANGSTDRWALHVFHISASTVVLPATAANISWARFWAKYVGPTHA